MPEDLSDSVSGSTELVFPDDSDDQTYRLRERSVYDAEEVRSEIESDIPQYGSWIPVELEDGEEAWLTAPSALRAELVEGDVRAGEAFHIGRMGEEGLDRSAPYGVTVSYRERDEEGRQSGLKA